MPDASEYAILNTAIGSFSRDWGVPDAPYLVPKRCYLVDHFDLVSKEHGETLAGLASIADRAAVKDLVSKASVGDVRKIVTSCEIVSQARAMELAAIRPEHKGLGILWISRAGIDPNNKKRAVVVLSETRNELAGSTWFLSVSQTTEGSWSVTARRLLSRF